MKAILKKLNFSPKWIDLILRCIRSVSYTFKVNGEQTRRIFPSRGLRQRDPLSPYIFVICTQGFSSLLRNYSEQGLIRGVRMARRGPIITHLFFADDSLVSFKVDGNSVRNFKDCLETYERALGQLVNYDKSALTFSPNTTKLNQDRTKQFLNIKENRGHELYLGAPSFSLRRKMIQFGFLKERMIRKIETWSHKAFSKGGNEILIKVVFLAIPTYSTSYFRVPTSLCKELEAICAWENSAKKKGIHWRKWDWLCRRKEEGGLGFKQLVFFNQALFAKQAWRIIAFPDSLVSQVLNARYFRSKDFMEADLGGNPSFVWRSIVWGRELLKEGLKWSIGSGSAVDAKYRNWFVSWSLAASSSCVASNQKVADYIDNNGRWNEPKIRSKFVNYEAEEILNTPIRPEGGRDRRFWRFHPRGEYTVSTGYRKKLDLVEKIEGRNSASSSSASSDLWKGTWKLKVPPKLKIFWWRLSWDIISVEMNLVRYHIPTSPSCFFCCFSIADTIHEIFECLLFAKGVWRALNVNKPTGNMVDKSVLNFLHNLVYLNQDLATEIIVAAAWGI